VVYSLMPDEVGGEIAVWSCTPHGRAYCGYCAASSNAVILGGLFAGRWPSQVLR
jgi:hypothetical protein